jgi:hypothetical protein
VILYELAAAVDKNHFRYYFGNTATLNTDFTEYRNHNTCPVSKALLHICILMWGAVGSGAVDLGSI